MYLHVHQNLLFQILLYTVRVLRRAEKRNATPFTVGRGSCTATEHNQALKLNHTETVAAKVRRDE